jgi:hypothetical protein
VAAELSATRALLEGLVDYAGLFPPAALPMADAAAEYARQRAGAHAWMLGRFICPVARLDELASAAAPHLAGEPWRISALAAASDGPAIERFNAAHAGLAIDALELKATSVAEIEAFASLPGLVRYVEVPLDGDLMGLLRCLRAHGCRAKVRTGGVTPGAFPEPASLSRFLAACATAVVPFKATAGLHHPVRSEHPLSYAQDAPRGVMHGFLNVFVAAALARQGQDETSLESVLREQRPAAFSLDPTGLAWGEHRVDAAELRALRHDFAVSFGSCSFAEPVADLQTLGLLP